MPASAMGQNHWTLGIHMAIADGMLERLVLAMENSFDLGGFNLNVTGQSRLLHKLGSEIIWNWPPRVSLILPSLFLANFLTNG